jgi:hypothetical protein
MSRREVSNVNEKEAQLMFVVVHHCVVDREKFLATDPRHIGGIAR